MKKKKSRTKAKRIVRKSKKHPRRASNKSKASKVRKLRLKARKRK